MTTRSRILTLFAAILLMATAGFGQGNPTGRITGRVTSGGDGLPGVRVDVTSPSLQQPRQVFTQANGDYLVGALPAGEYKLTFELESFEPQVRRIAVSIAQVQSLDVDLALQAVSDEIVVTGEGSTISETNAGATTYTQDLVEKLSIDRTITQAVALAPGTAATGPSNSLSISGGQSFENLYLINGVPVNENLRGQPADLFIEDAIQETTVQTSGVSAEYGRFSGGVVNTVTKSGSDEFSGSLRDNLTNEKWASQTPFGENRVDSIDDTFEATLGGPLWRERLWFFGAARQLERVGVDQTDLTNLSFPTSTEETRIEGKLTLAVTPRHQLQLGAVDVSDQRDGNVQGSGAIDLGAVNNGVEFPESSFSAIYTGILSNSFFVEAQYGERSLEFLGIGGLDGNLRTGTPFLDTSLGGLQYHQPVFCGNCPNPDARETKTAQLKGSYFLSTTQGSHDFVFGVDTFDDIRSGDNTQSATGFEVWSSSSILRNGEVFPVIVPVPFAFDTFIIHRPILQSSLGTDFISNSAYVNDRWQLNDRWSFNLGLRYDENDGTDSAGNVVANDSNWSPRLGVNYDWKGDGDLVLRASAGRYVTRLSNGVADGSSAAGNPAFFLWLYGGPAINPDPNAPVLTTAEEALDILFDWFESVGGVNNTDFLNGQTIPGATSRVDGSLDSPKADEITLGFSKRLGDRGLVRADYVRREYGDFYFNRTDTTTGTVLDGDGNPADLTLIQNDDSLLDRAYDGLHTSITYRLNDRLNLGGNWTWSHARGNFDGETVRSGPVAGVVGQYPEYNAFEQSNPRRDLLVDQRHKVRAWLLWDAITTERHHLTVSLLQGFFSGAKYGALGSVDSRPFVNDPGYVTPPVPVGYYYTSPNAFKTDDITSTDLALNYSFHLTLAGRDFEIFLQPEILNVFGEEGVDNVNTSDVLDATNTAGLQPFDPFTAEPVRGVHWDLGPSFGKPQNDDDYQTPRTFRLSLGFRF